MYSCGGQCIAVFGVMYSCVGPCIALDGHVWLCKDYV